MHKNLPCVRFSCKILIHLFTKVCIVRQGLSISSLFLILMVGCIKAGYSLQLEVIFIGNGYQEKQEVWQLSKWHKQKKCYWYTATWIKTPVKLKWRTTKLCTFIFLFFFYIQQLCLGCTYECYIFFGQTCHTMRFGSQTQATQAVVGTGALLAPTIVDVTNSSLALSHAFLSWWLSYVFEYFFFIILNIQF